MPHPRVRWLGTGRALDPERDQASILMDCLDTCVLLHTGGGLVLVRRLLAGRDRPSRAFAGDV